MNNIAFAVTEEIKSVETTIVLQILFILHI